MMFCTLRGTVGGVLRMSEDAVIGETISFARTGGAHRAHNGFARTMCAVVEAITIVMLVCRCSYSMSDAVDAVVNVVSPCSSTVKGRVTRVNSTNVQDEGLRIGERGRQMNSKVKISQTRHVSRISMVLNMAQSQSVHGRPLLATIYRWPSLKKPVGFNTNCSIPI
jgi:hypothetical protein